MLFSGSVCGRHVEIFAGDNLIRCSEAFPGRFRCREGEVGDEGWSPMSDESRVRIAGELSLSRILGGITITINHQPAD